MSMAATGVAVWGASDTTNRRLAPATVDPFARLPCLLVAVSVPPIPSVSQRIATELAVREHQVQAAINLFDGGATVPFVARYRKEATGGLDDAQLRALDERLRYLRELDERRAAILESIEAQGKLDDALRAQVMAADSKARLEDIYLPYKPKRRTKAQIAREAGLEPLANALLADPTLLPGAAAAPYVDPDRGVADADAALEGARAILTERFAEDADVIGGLRERLWRGGRLVSAVRAGREDAGAKFSDYFSFSEPFHHAAVAPDPGRLPGREGGGPRRRRRPGRTGGLRGRIAARFGIADQGRPADAWLGETVRWAWKTQVSVHLGIDVRTRLRQAAEDEAVRVFAANLRDLLLAAPAGSRATMGLDPGFRTGVKVAVVDAHRQGGGHRHHLPPRAPPPSGTRRSTGWTGWPGPRRSSWWPSATAPPPGRPTSWPASSISRQPASA